MGPSVLDFTHDTFSDVFYNPAYISAVNGFQLYTNLSNLGSPMAASILGNELSSLRNAIYPTNMVGFMGRWRFLSGGAFYVTEGYNLEIGLSENDESLYRWEEGVIPHSSLSTDDFESTTGLKLGGRHIVGLGTINMFGLKLGVMGTVRTFSASMLTKSDQVREYFEDGNLIERDQSTYEYNVGMKSTLLGLSVGSLVAGENTELSIAGGIRPGKITLTSEFKDSWIDAPYYTWGDYDQNPEGNFREEYERNTDAISLVGSELYANARLMRQVSEGSRLSLFGHFSSALFPIDLTSENHDKYERMRPNQVSDTTGEITGYGDYYLEEYSSQRNGTGSLVFLSLKGGMGLEHIFSDGTMFLAGVKGVYTFITGNIDVDPRTTQLTLIDIENDPDYPEIYQEGYIRTVNYKDPRTISSSGHLLYLEIPSALEFNLRDKLKLRLGANQYIPLYGTGHFTIKEGNGPDEVTTKYTHGPDAGTTITDEAPDNTSKDEFTASLSSTNLNYSRYYAGLGYAVNENVQIDVIHFSQLTSLSTWHFSIQINF